MAWVGLDWSSPTRMLTGAQPASAAGRRHHLPHRIWPPSRVGQKMPALRGPMPPETTTHQPMRADMGGFRPHAQMRMQAHVCKRLEQLCRCITRPAFSDERMQLNAASGEFVFMVMNRLVAAGELTVPANMRLMFLSLCSPELNSAKHLWDAPREDCFGNASCSTWTTPSADSAKACLPSHSVRSESSRSRDSNRLILHH